MHPDVYTTYDNLGQAYINAGNKELAVKSFEKSLQLNPANVNATKKLEQLRDK